MHAEVQMSSCTDSLGIANPSKYKRGLRAATVPLLLILQEFVYIKSRNIFRNTC